MAFLSFLYRNIWPPFRQRTSEREVFDSTACRSEEHRPSLVNALVSSVVDSGVSVQDGGTPTDTSSTVTRVESDEVVEETRIEISCDDGGGGGGGEKFERSANVEQRRHVVDSAAEMAATPRESPETIRIRDLNLEHVKLFTPTRAPPITQSTQPLSTESHSCNQSIISDTDDVYNPLLDMYDIPEEWQQNDLRKGQESLNPHEILCSKRLLGHGASSQVYRGVYRGQDVVLKFIIGTNAETFQKEFRRECVIFQRIPPHPNIVKMYGTVGMCIVLEYCNFGTLFDLIHNSNYPLPLPTVKRILQEIASSLHHLHSRRMIHRDLKPSNLLMTQENGRDVIKLADFGLARNYLKNATMTVGIGTWQYSSPEFFTNSKLTAKSDIYAFGVVIWELCTRRMPYGDTHFKEVYEKILKGHSHALSVPEEMDAVLGGLYSRCIASEAHHRPSFSEILSILRDNKVCVTDTTVG